MPAKQPNVHNVSKALLKELVPLETIKPDPANLRLHGEDSIEAIKASLERFGQQKPVVIDRRGVLVAGHGMYSAAKAAGWTHIAATKSGLSGAERIAYAIADNRTAELSKWDDDALARVVGGMTEAERVGLGFSQDDIAAMLDDVDEAELVEDVAVPAAPPAIAKRGDLWHLGEHRLLCGDSTDLGDVELVMASEKAALCATDPPYLVDYTGVRAGNVGRDWSAQYRETEIEDASRFFLELFKNVLSVTHTNAAIYCWHAERRLVELMQVWKELGILHHQTIVWVKPCSVFGSVFWHFRHETCAMGWRQGYKPAHDGKHDHNSVWVADGVTIPIDQLTKQQLVALLKDSSSLWEIDWEGKGRPVGNEHPTQKPIEIFARPIRKHTRVGDLCFEPFSGSGSNIIACEQTKRRCRAIEIEPTFVDAAIRRWQKLTGQSARLEGGATWEEVAAQRGVPCQVDHSDAAPTPDAKPSREEDDAQSTRPHQPARRGARPRDRQQNVGTGPTGES